jgi:hypothetical protein
LFGTLSGFLANKLLTPKFVDEEPASATDNASATPGPLSQTTAPASLLSATAAMNLALEMPDYLASGSLDERIAVLRAILDANQRFTDRVRNELDAIEDTLQDRAANRD